MVAHNGQERKFSYADNEICISKDLDYFNSLLQEFTEEAQKASFLYREKLKAYGDIWKLAEKGEAEGVEIFKDIIQRRIVVPAIKEYQIFDIDADMFYDNYCEEINTVWHQIFQENIYTPIKNLSDAYDAKVAERADKIAEGYEDYGDGGGNIAVAGGMIGGLGLGLGLILADAAARAAFGSIGAAGHIAANEKDRTAINEYLRNIFINFKRSNFIHYFVLALVNAKWTFLTNKGIVDANDVFFEEGDLLELSDKAKAFLNNLEHIADAKVKKAFSEVLLLAPYSQELYRAMYEKFGDSNGELKKIADYFRVDFLSAPKDVDEVAGVIDNIDEDEKGALRFLATIKYDVYYPENQRAEIIKRLLNIPESKYSIIANVEKKDPRIMLIVSLLGGLYGIDRFVLGQTKAGVLKFITLGGVFVWWFGDLVKIKNLTKEYNYERLMALLVRLEKEFGIV